MTDTLGFTLHRRGTHPLAGRTVLQLVPSLDAADADRTPLHVVAALAQAGARPLVAGPPGRLVSELQAIGGVWIEFAAATRNPLLMLRNIAKLKTILATERVDLVHARTRPAAWVAYSATRRGTLPFVTSLHQIPPNRSIVRQRYDSVMARGDLILASSRHAMAAITGLYPTVRGRVVLIRPGLDLRPYRAAIDPARVQALRSAWQVAPDERIVLMMGAPVAKAQRAVLEALDLLQANGLKDLKLVVVGPAAASRDLDQSIRATKLAGRVRKVEQCADLPAALLTAAVLVVPAIAPEAFGRVVVEAQAVGVPAVVADAGALSETVLAPPETEAAKRTGWRVATSDSGLLAVAIKEALGLGASGREALAERARRQAEERFSVERMTRETLEAYARAIEQHAAMAG